MPAHKQPASQPKSIRQKYRCCYTVWCVLCICVFVIWHKKVRWTWVWASSSKSTVENVLHVYGKHFSINHLHSQFNRWNVVCVFLLSTECVDVAQPLQILSWTCVKKTNGTKHRHHHRGMHNKFIKNKRTINVSVVLIKVFFIWTLIRQTNKQTTDQNKPNRNENKNGHKRFNEWTSIERLDCPKPHHRLE